MVCHMHQPNMFMNSYLGYTMWDYESDAPFMWPEEQQNLSIAEQREVLDRNPEGAVVRGKWADLDFLRTPPLLLLWLPFTPVALLSSHCAPTTTVSPDTDTDLPKVSRASGLEALR